MLRHYHQIGLLEPADVDPNSGYRRYVPEQIPTAQVIRRFRDLDMPLEQIKAVLAAPDLDARNRLINEHLAALQESLAQTQAAVASLESLLGSSTTEGEPEITLRRVPATQAAAITSTIDIADASAWYQGAMGELYATLAAQGVAVAGHPGGIYEDELFTQERGRATVFLPCTASLRPTGRVTPVEIPAIELAIIVHRGPIEEIDRAYGALAAYVARNAIAVDGPIREYYPVSGQDTRDSAAWRTEVGWPIFTTRPGSPGA